MRLEVLIDQEEPLLFSLDNKEKIIIGSSDFCDIVIKAEGISRKHVLLICYPDEFFVIDQGSANGSFINEERLVPGQRVEFTTFFPIRLGANVILSLLSDDDASDLSISEFNMSSADNDKIMPPGQDQGTRFLSRNDILTTPSSLELHIKKKSVRSKSSIKKEKITKKTPPEKKFKFLSEVLILLFLGVLYYQYSQQETEKTQTVEVQSPIAEVPQIQPVAEEVFLVKNEFLPTKENLKKLLNETGCFSESEKNICQTFRLVEPDDVVQSGKDFHVFIRDTFGKEFFSKVAQKFPDIDKDRAKILSIIYLMSKRVRIPEKYLDFRFHLHVVNEENQVIGSMAFFANGLDAFRNDKGKDFVREILFQGNMALTSTNKYFNFY